MEEDEALSFLLSTTLELAGYCVETLENTQAIGSLMSLPVSFTAPPAVVVIDAGNLESTLGLDICKVLKADLRFVNSKFIVTSIFHDKEMVLNAGADLYLPKPYELATLMKWVKIFIKETNA